jgi:hypothetical protein
MGEKVSFERSCIFGINGEMQVIEEDNEAGYKQLLASGAWFDHPLKAKEAQKAKKEGTKYEGQIRRKPRKGRGNVEHSSKPNGSGAQQQE